VEVTGIHEGLPVAVVPSLLNTGPGPVTVQITPDYRAPGRVVTVGPTRDAGVVGAGPNPRKFDKLDPTRGLGVLSSVAIRFSGSPSFSDTEMAFLGLVDGVFSELDFDLGIDLFTGGSEFVLPGLENDATDLFIGVDLTQWLTNPTPFSAADVFSFIGGLDPLLPGFLVGTSPVTLGPLGLETASPFTGDAFVRTTLDGEVGSVPEPGSGLLALASSIRRRQKTVGAALALR
jgi:hypothetical protein